MFSITAIENSISVFKKELNENIEDINLRMEISKKSTLIDPCSIREDYNELMLQLIDDEDEIKLGKDRLDTNIKELEECKSLLIETEKLIEERKNFLNKINIGTLEGRCREEINKNQVPMDEHGETVMNQYYDEYKEINRVGGKNSSKRNKTKRKKYTTKNGNKSKNRRLKRNV